MNDEGGGQFGPRMDMAGADKRALGIDDPRMNEMWLRYCIKQATAIAHDVRIDPRDATHEGVRLSWLTQALRQNSQTFDTSVIVAELKTVSTPDPHCLQDRSTDCGAQQPNNRWSQPPHATTATACHRTRRNYSRPYPW
ncbi:hypothetical protein [Rhodococcus sp. BH5]|uniref:hypothetical protein n=1 Tax=Rhodococcus sp. BH5 TaxID=2871702 RepID=UPI0022CD53DF|nr:hypothetical protein [Rhodococcus sp. BH5]MCZ9635308.1 hypothetical protein [Rhodococcus sp. BH5]